MMILVQKSMISLNLSEKKNNRFDSFGWFNQDLNVFVKMMDGKMANNEMQLCASMHSIVYRVQFY